MTVHLAISSGSNSFHIDNRTPNTHERQHLTTLHVSTLFRSRCGTIENQLLRSKASNLLRQGDQRY
jgi:hypothetical protein